MPAGTPARLLSAVSAEEVHLAIPGEVHRELRSVLFPDEGHPFASKYERGAFCVITRSTGVRRLSYLVRDVVHPTSADDLAFKHGGRSEASESDSQGWDNGRASRSRRTLGGGLTFSKDYHQRALRRAKKLGGGLMRVHTHPAGVTPSPLDRRSARRVFEGDSDRLAPGEPLMAAITNTSGAWSARVYEFGSASQPHVTPVTAIRLVGPRFRKLDTPESTSGPAGAFGTVSPTAQDSGIQLWGEQGQRILAGLRVGLVGCGGVGSILASQLPRLGVGELVLVDFDRLERANANRSAGASRMDVRQARLKTYVAQREAHRAAIQPGFETTVVDGSVVEDDPTYAAVPALLDCDLVIAAVDAARPRKVLDHLGTLHCIPVLSGGSRLHANEDGLLREEAKIQTSITGPGFSCFGCQRVWKREHVEREREHPRYRGERGYVEGGVDPSETPRSPSVIGINSIVAGLLQHRLTALTLGIAGRVVGTHRLKPRDLEVRWFATTGRCEEHCERPPLAAGDRYRLPLGTDWTMRYEREDIPIPETVTIHPSRAAEILKTTREA